VDDASLDLVDLLPTDLPDDRELIADGLALGRGVQRSVSLYCQEKGVVAERHWREQARELGVPCTCINLGLATWSETREALVLIYEDALRRGIRPPDRFNLLAERRMGLPKHMRADAPQETGPVLWTDQDWWELAHTVPIQPQVGDNMIGGPGSVENALDALRVGVTYIGVLSQYVWRWPYWDDDVAQLEAVIRAIAALAAKREEGVCLETYLDDGYPGVFHDYANYIGWAMLERYIAEELIGAACSTSWGGLTRNPIVKSAVTLALDRVNPKRVPTAFIQGDTIGMVADHDSNFAVMSSDVLFAKATDTHYKLGSAPLAVPVTELERIPSWTEIAAAHAVNRQLEEYVPLVAPIVDWPQIEVISDRLVKGGRRFFSSALEAMQRSGIDTRSPTQVLWVMKHLGAPRWEELFGAGEPDESFLRGRRPVLQTEIVTMTGEKLDSIAANLSRTPLKRIGQRRVVVASTDVHEFAKFLLTSTLSRAGASVIDAGINRDPEDIVKVLTETGADAVVLTTHNGVALSFAEKLVEGITSSRLGRVPIFMGGVLNEDVAGSDLPADVRASLRQIGIRTPESIEALVQALDAIDS
jgi:methylmalonyl-CoA mutase cobalamin-binding subunit